MIPHNHDDALTEFELTPQEWMWFNEAIQKQVS